MIRRPPRSTRTDTLFPYTKLFRSVLSGVSSAVISVGADRRILLAERVLGATRSEEHTSELQSLMRISYAVFCLQKKPYSCIILVSSGLMRHTHVTRIQLKHTHTTPITNTHPYTTL